MSKISELSDGGVVQGGDTLIAVRSGGNVKVTYGGSTTANIDGGTIDDTVIGGTTAAAVTTTALVATTADINGGTIDGTVIGGSTAAAGTFTTFTSTGIDDNATSTAITIDASRRVNIGKSATDSGAPVEVQANSVGQSLNIYGRASDGFSFLGFFENNSNTQYASIRSSNSSNLILRTGGSDSVVVNSTGNVGIGTSSPATSLDVRTDDGTTNAVTRSLSVSHTTTGTAANGIGSGIVFNQESSTGALRTSAHIDSIFTDATDASLASALTFTTRSVNTLAERMRIDSSGNLLVGGTTPTFVNSTRAYFQKNINSSSNSNTLADQNAVVNISGTTGITNTEAATSLLCLTGNSGFATTPGRLIKGYSGNGATTHCFEVQHDGDVLNTNNSYGSISDERAKQDITDASSSWDDIKNIRVRKYRLKSNVKEHANNPNLGDAPYHIGVISQEVESVSPGLISQDLLDNGTPDPDSIKYVKYSILYMKAVKALQEAITRIETLEIEVAALKGAN